MVEVPPAVLSQVMELLSPYLTETTPPPSGDDFASQIGVLIRGLRGDGSFTPEQIDQLRRLTQGDLSLVNHLFGIAQRFESRKGPIANTPAFIFGVLRKKTFDEWQDEVQRQQATSVQSSELDAARKRVEARMREEEDVE